MNLEKLNREPFYNKMNPSMVEGAGYFEDTNDVEINWDLHTNLLCTPINFLKSTNDKPKCVLISTGAFSPLHSGHIEMMIEAKKVLSKDYDVLGGYISPGHDEYIKQKTGKEWIPIHDRLDYANDLIKQYDWLVMDPWEGVFAPGAVNFTSVVYRLSLYLKKHYKEDVTIFFVCGGDNCRFSKAFENCEGFGTVVVTRPGYEINYEYYDIENAYYAKCNNTNSSTKIRKKGFKIKPKASQLKLRISDDYHEILTCNILKKYFPVVSTIKIYTQINAWFNNIKYIDEKQIINLDEKTNFKNRRNNNLNISRLYDLYGQKQLGYTHRPKTNCLTKQITDFELNSRNVYLLDDDIFSGNTMKYTENLLKQHNIKVVGKLSYLTSNENTEIADADDFLFGYGNGLVVKYDNELIRVPYIYPFVCPTTRVSVYAPLQFSIDIWEMNMNIWIENKKRIKDYTKLNYLLKLGFNESDTIYDVCKHYHTLLTEIQNKYYV